MNINRKRGKFISKHNTYINFGRSILITDLLYLNRLIRYSKFIAEFRLKKLGKIKCDISI